MTEDQFKSLMRRASSVQFCAVIISRDGETETRTEWFFNLSDADENEYDDGDLSETIQ